MTWAAVKRRLAKIARIIGHFAQGISEEEASVLAREAKDKGKKKAGSKGKRRLFSIRR